MFLGYESSAWYSQLLKYLFTTATVCGRQKRQAGYGRGLANNDPLEARCNRFPTAFCILLRRQDSNLRPQAYETCKLPTALLRCIKQGDKRKDSVIALPN